MATIFEQSVAGPPLLATKLYAPRWRAGLVSRPKLIALLEAGTDRKLTLVSAPAGFGKSTLLAERLAASPARARSTGWVSLDEGDNDPARFWAYVITALQRIVPGIGQDALTALHSPQVPPIEPVLTALINEIATIEDDVALILDDLHVIHVRAVHEAIAFLLDNLPPQLHLVISTREDPQLPLPRLRARGQLTELRASDLRFSPTEAVEFLNTVMGLNLLSADVVALETRTEGWIAGLQLAALSMRGRSDVSGFIQSFAGDDRYIVDYLVEEVLQRQPEQVRRFLLQTSILDRLNGPLCNAVTGEEDGKSTLENLERANLFVISLDDKRDWYRYHHLFADVLRVHAMDELPNRIATLRGRAADWFELNGMAAEAIEQAYESRDHAAVARLLVAHAEEFKGTGLWASIARWAASLPAEMGRTRPRLAVVLATSAIVSESNLDAFRTYTAMAETAINQIEAAGFDSSDDPDGTVVGPEGMSALKGEVLALKLMHSARDLSPDEVARISSEALELIPRNRHHVRGILQLINAGIESDVSDLPSALVNLNKGIDDARRTGNPSLLASALGHRGELYVTLGQLEAGRRSFEEALLVGATCSTEAEWVMCRPHSCLAEISLEQGDLAAATDHASKALELAGKAPQRNFVLFAQCIAAQISLATGNLEAVEQRLQAAGTFARGARIFRFASYLSAVKLNIFCPMGDLTAAANVVRDRGLTPDVAAEYEREEEITAYARYLIARGDYNDASHVLARLVALERTGGRVRQEIHALVLLAIAHEHDGKRAQALNALGRSTVLGEPGGFHRSFTAEGPVMIQLLAALAEAIRHGRGPAEAGSQAYLASLLPATDIQPDSAAATSEPGTTGLVEQLTAREIEIMRLIATGMQNDEIAAALFISRSTVKRHIANAYGKLAARNRTEAIARANELNLLQAGQPTRGTDW